MINLKNLPKTSRVGRYPKHTFNVRSKPFTAQPFMLARVLPGETMENLFMESRVITDPLRNPIIGWKKEYFYFYVRITDLLNDSIRDMFVDPTNAEIAGLDEANNVQRTYTAKGGIDWLALSMNRIVDEYFRDEKESPTDHRLADGTHIVQIRENTFLDSITSQAEMPEGAAIASATDAGDLDRLMDAFAQLKALGIANMTYEDWLRANGIAIPNKDENKPEMLARFSEFQYPSNTVQTDGTGLVSSACSWVFKNGERKRLFFKEPGFIVGITVTRPKVYFGALAGAAAGFAQRAWDWMPNYLRDMPDTSWKAFATGTGPLGDRTTDPAQYFLDMRDELLYGDQFHNLRAFEAVPTNDGANHLLALPDAALNYKYPNAAMIDSFFVGTTATTTTIREDGYVSLQIKGHERDHTVGNLASI